MNQAPLSFSVSQSEITRRTTAFTHFMFSLLVSGVVSCFIIFPHLVGLFLWPMLLLILLLCGFILALRVNLARFFKSYLQSKVYLANGYFIRKTFKSQQQVLLKDITHLQIKRTKRGHIREIGIWSGKQRLYLNSLSHFERFTQKLVQSLHCPVTESQEKLDYDHPLFYPLLGLLLGVITILTLKTIFKLDYVFLLLILFSGYLFILGNYFMLTTPLVQHYGEKLRQSDYLWGFILIVLSIALASIGLLHSASLSLPRLL